MGFFSACMCNIFVAILDKKNTKMLHQFKKSTSILYIQQIQLLLFYIQNKVDYE